MSLDTLSNVKTRLGVSGTADDTLLGLLQDSADRFIANWCERDFEGGTFTEYYPGGSEFVHLRNFPVATVTSVKVDPNYVFGSDTLISSSSYVAHTDWGVIQSLPGPFLPRLHTGLVNNEIRSWTRGPRVVQVVYTVATSAVPNDVKEAYARLIGIWYRRVKTESAVTFIDVREQNFGDMSVAYAGAPRGLPEEVYELLAPYRAPRI
jgi:Phage gp6-like head-tail connector protein